MSALSHIQWMSVVNSHLSFALRHMYITEGGHADPKKAPVDGYKVCDQCTSQAHTFRLDLDLLSMCV